MALTFDDGYVDNFERRRAGAAAMGTASDVLPDDRRHARAISLLVGSSGSLASRNCRRASDADHCDFRPAGGRSRR